MYIKSIVLDGFKSYGTRTEINGFDSKFNAITGLNGSGKSNILDSICFVLGITNLSNVRVNSLQDLIYKSGNSGITKATVSITFDNTDRDQRPIGFDNCDEIVISRQIVLGGKNKYMINGITVQNKRIQDLFCSVQLNVNNPHFLIMQGRITKVLNMKPLEILAMLEEAAGTRMYETKRVFAEKTMEKKNSKLATLNSMINDELGPKLDKLREERRILFEYQRVMRELEQAQIIYAAWQYFDAKAKVTSAKDTVTERQEVIDQMKNSIQNNVAEVNRIEELLNTMQNDNNINETLKSFEVDLKDKEKILATANASEKSLKDNLVAKAKEKIQLVKSLKDDEKALKTREDELAKSSDTFKRFKEAEESDNAAYVTATKRFEAINAGMELGEDGEAVTIQEQLISAQQEAAQASTECKQASMKLQFCQKQLHEKKQELGAASADYMKHKCQMENIEKEIKTLEKQMGHMNFNDKKLPALEEKRRSLDNDCRNIREKLDRFELQYPQTEFHYSNPEPHFNRNSVKGVVCKLFKITDKSAATALETAAGGRLFNVIVDNDVTSKKLLQNGRLQHRTTIIPLNKIKGQTIPANVVQLAQNLVGKDKCQPALSLIRYSKELQPAMEYIFGSVFICSDLNVAKTVTFNNRIRCKCVTLEGDITDPSGTLSGGAARKGGSILLQLDGIKDFQTELSAKEQELVKIEQELQNFRQTSEKFGTIKERYELRSHELNIVKQQLQQTTHHQKQEEIETLKKSIAELTEQVKVSQEREKVNSKKAKTLETRIKSSNDDREQQIKMAETEMNQLKKKLESSKSNWLQKEQDYETMKLEMDELQKALVTGNEQIKSCEESIIEMQTKLEEAKVAVVTAKEEVTKLQAVIKEHKAAAIAKNKELQAKVVEKNNLTAKNAELELEIKKQSHELSEFDGQLSHWQAKENELKKKIKSDDPRVKEAEKLTKKEAETLITKIKTHQDHANVLGRNVNPNAQSMLDQEEKLYTALAKKKKEIEVDKKELVKVMDNLDVKKQRLLKIAVKKISTDFGSIFGTILQGTDAKLEKLEGKDILDGLEIKVCIGTIWKTSLTELSGGQRSLVALSLILAMLLFKPAPIYILDEVDAALDLSHTQNIGNMLRMHFKHSQFIIVSLKDGMFSNANVLFQTRFVDGMSVVQKTTNRDGNNQ